MNKHHSLATLLILGLAGCAQPTPEQQFIADAMTALGGRARIEAVRTLTIEGTGVNYNLGQDMKPEAATQTFAISDYKRQIDIANSRQRVEQTRTPKFTFFQGPQAQKQIQGLDGDVAFNVNAAGAATRTGGPAANDRRADLYHHPLKLLRATMDPKATVTNVRQVETASARQADITTAAGMVFTLTIDGTGLPVSISSKAHNANLGDVVIKTTFDNYQDVGTFRLPAHFSGQVDQFVTWTIDATRQAVDDNISDLAAPASASAPAPAPAAPTVTAVSIGKGVWFLAGQSHHSVLVEFADHLMLIEAPQSEARTLAVIAKARETVPGKPLTQLVTTHHHFDHTAGMRAAIAEGLTVVTQSGNRAWVENMAKRPFTIQPDALAKAAKPVTVDAVEAEKEFKDATMAVTVYHVAGNPHSDTMLMVYIPRDRVLIEVDAFSPGGQYNPYATNLLENIQTRKLRVDRIVPLHGAIGTLADLTKVAK